MDLDEIVEHMFSMVGNAGQESIMTQGMDSWVDWAAEAMEEDSPPDYGDMVSMLVGAIGDEKYSATDLIWDEGYDLLTAEWEEKDNEEQSEMEMGGRLSRSRSPREREKERNRRDKERNAERNKKLGRGLTKTEKEAAKRAQLVRRAVKVARVVRRVPMI